MNQMHALSSAPSTLAMFQVHRARGCRTLSRKSRTRRVACKPRSADRTDEILRESRAYLPRQASDSRSGLLQRWRGITLRCNEVLRTQRHGAKRPTKTTQSRSNRVVTEASTLQRPATRSSGSQSSPDAGTGARVPKNLNRSERQSDWNGDRLQRRCGGTLDSIVPPPFS